MLCNYNTRKTAGAAFRRVIKAAGRDSGGDKIARDRQPSLFSGAIFQGPSRVTLGYTCGTTAEIVTRLTKHAELEALAARTRNRSVINAQAKGRGRPKLGVVGREVTLLPRHWEWLARQSGGASQALRRLVDEARRSDGGQTRTKVAREASYRFLSTMAGDLPGFEEVIRALFSGDGEAFADRMAGWPPDVRNHAVKLATAIRPEDCP